MKNHIALQNGKQGSYQLLNDDGKAEATADFHNGITLNRGLKSERVSNAEFSEFLKWAADEQEKFLNQSSLTTIFNCQSRTTMHEQATDSLQDFAIRGLQNYQSDKDIVNFMSSNYNQCLEVCESKLAFAKKILGI